MACLCGGRFAVSCSSKGLSMTKRLFSGLVLLLAAVAPAWAQTPVDPRVTAISPYVTDDTAAIIRINLRKVDLIGLADQAAGLLPEDNPAKQKGVVKNAAKTFELVRKSVVAGGAGDVYLFVQANPDGGGPGAPFVMAPIEAGKDPQAICDSLQAFAEGAGTLFVHNNNVMFCPTDVVDKIKAIRGGDPTRFAEAFRFAGQTDVQIIVAPTPAELAKIADELDPFSDEQKEVFKASKSLIITGNLPPKGALATMLFMKDEASATKVNTLLTNLVQNELPPDITKDPFMSRVIELFTPKQSGDSLRIILTDANGGITKLAGVLKDGVPELTAAVKSGDLFLPPEAEAILLGADAARGRSRGPAGNVSTNNLKQMALAVHNFHDTYNGLPPQYSTTADGKPLLSWRVAILPYIEQKQLYDLFKLDEPWDSEHNKALIAKMPNIYKSPYGDAGEGKTIYLGSGGKNGLFTLPKENGMGWKPGSGFRDVRDGLSNTVLVTEVAEESAVIWSKPDTDYVWNEKEPFQLLPKRPDGLFTVVLADGSVRKLKIEMKPQMWQHLLDRQDGNVVDLDGN